MNPELADLIEHLNGLIFLVRAAWQSSSGKCAEVAQTFRFIGRMHQAAAIAQRNNPTDGLQISEDDIP